MGQVKTRLAATVGQEMALSIYEHLVEMTLSAVSRVQAEALLFYHPEVPAKHVRFGKSYTQVGDDLGSRLTAAFECAFVDYHQVIVLGTDCPYVTPELLERAFTALEGADIVIGPACDGGYYLLGLNGVAPSLFQEIKWSSDQVLSQTVAKANAAGMQIEMLEELSDIDYEQDWLDYLASMDT